MGWGTSDVVEAQRLANQANIGMTESTNKWNYDIAHEANLWNWQNAQAQNEWNIQQWERENAYNDPSAQMERAMKAGINPIFALGSMDMGQAQHLESAQVAPASVPTMQPGHVNPEYDPYGQQRLGNIIAASRDLMNAGLGFKQLGIQEFNAETARASQQSQAQLNRASVAEKKAATNALEIQNEWNTQTFGVRAEVEAQKLFNMKSQMNNLDASSEAYRSLKSKYDADTALIREKTNRVAEDYQLAWQNLDVARLNARANMTSATAAQMNAETNQEQLGLARERLSFDQSFAEATVKKWNNDQRLQFLDKFGRTITGEMKAGVGVEGLGVTGKAGLSEKSPANEALLKELNYQAIKLYGEDPTLENAKVAKRANEVTNMYIQSQMGAADGSAVESYNSSNTSVLNPSLNSFGREDPWSVINGY